MYERSRKIEGLRSTHEQKIGLFDQGRVKVQEKMPSLQNQFLEMLFVVETLAYLDLLPFSHHDNRNQFPMHDPS